MPPGDISMYVTDTLNTLVAEYCNYYPDRKDPIAALSVLKLDPVTRGKIVDTGICLKVAQWVVEKHPDAVLRVIWRSYGDDYDDEAVHCVIEHNGRFYDTTNIEGVSNWQDLYWIRRGVSHGRDFISPDADWDAAGVKDFGNLGDSPFLNYLKTKEKEF